jgi:uncharacterized protein YndB with AHSA1/START domain
MYAVSIEIPAAPPQVFRALTEPALVARWNPEAAEVRPPEGGLRVGAVVSAVVEEFGRKFVVQWTVTTLEPDRALSYDMTTPMWSGRIDYVLTRQPDRTTVSFQLTPVPPSGWKRYPLLVLAIATRPLVQRRLRSRLHALRSVVQTTTV